MNEIANALWTQGHIILVPAAIIMLILGVSYDGTYDASGRRKRRIAFGFAIALLVIVVLSYSAAAWMGVLA